jgi:transglutaminase-like putative cysteine protease
MKSGIEIRIPNCFVLRGESRMTIHRRNFLAGSIAMSALATSRGVSATAPAGDAFAPQPGAWRTFEVTTRIEVATPQGVTRAWIPLPSVTGTDWMRPLGDSWQAPGGKVAAQRVGAYGAKMIAVEWRDGTDKPVVEVVSRVATRDRSFDLTRPIPHQRLGAAERKLYLKPTRLLPTDGIVKQTSDQITAGAKSDVDKAHRIYEWIVINTFRDPKTPGCGNGDVASMLRSGDLGGKCADLNGLYVALARAAGLPSRDLYGVRVAPSRFGYKSLGANTETITKAQHCRAEVYLSDFGWVPVDPADVRKVMLEEPPGNLPLDDAKVAAARQTLFGAWETNWIAYNEAHDVALPGSQHEPIGFLMYAQGQTAAGPIDCLNADAFKYTITSKEIAA